MKKILLLTLFLSVSFAGFTQDIISLANGKKLEVIVTEITPTLIRYKLFTEKEGKVFFVFKDDVIDIMYQSEKTENVLKSDSMVAKNESNRTKNPLPSDQNENVKESEDVIYLKNGNTVRGTIIEHLPKASTKIKTAKGNIYVFQTIDIKKITKNSKK